MSAHMKEQRPLQRREFFEEWLSANGTLLPFVIIEAVDVKGVAASRQLRQRRRVEIFPADHADLDVVYFRAKDTLRLGCVLLHRHRSVSILPPSATDQEALITFIHNHHSPFCIRLYRFFDEWIVEC